MPDARVQAAIDHWAPRFVAMGVDYNDFVRTTGRIERWEDWLESWSELAEEHLTLAREAEQTGRRRSAGEAYLHAALCLHFGKFVWVLDAAAHRDATERAIAALTRAHAHLDPTAERIEARLDGERLGANLRRPAGSASAPLVLLIPGLDSTKEEFFHWENVFLDRGMATLSMDGPGQGESGFNLPIRPDYEVAVAALLDELSARPELRLDLTRVGERWEELPPLTREAFTVKSAATDEADARRRAGELSLHGVAARITQPALYVTGALDRIVPWGQTERAARETPDGSFVLYEQGSHVCSNVPYRYRPLVGDWMAERLAPAG
ncbi:MAG TPA: alpha/beta hydrolase [Solirubrobacteraceae bacterium]|nr:alpha/beta hydrolase [Solirubrobacteraceae bacterium]